ncbi:MAG: hypothetical protein M1831_000551 [Alyxoria varia]|nr:MAG: hypothetical protein M1831_000551 [Alyxoria varia]
MVLFYTAITLVKIFECTPREKIWLGSTPGRCIDFGKLTAVTGSVNIVSDFTILFLPLPLIWRLQMPMRRKIGASAVFATGLFSAEVCAGLICANVTCLPGFFHFLLSKTHGEASDTSTRHSKPIPDAFRKPIYDGHATAIAPFLRSDCVDNSRALVTNQLAPTLRPEEWEKDERHYIMLQDVETGDRSTPQNHSETLHNQHTIDDSKRQPFPDEIRNEYHSASAAVIPRARSGPRSLDQSHKRGIPDSEILRQVDTATHSERVDIADDMPSVGVGLPHKPLDPCHDAE